MTMREITAKLRRKNQGQYRLLGLCIFMSLLLVTSFTAMFFSSSVQELLPPGGDTRKLMWLMLGVVSVGCLIFTLYGSSLFFRNKSREFGVMLALGTEKKELARRLAAELAVAAGKYIFFGIIVALPVSWLIWKLFCLMIISTAQPEYRLSAVGILAGLLFAAALTLSILILGIRFIRRTNVMDILNACRKTEMVREIRPWFGKAGAALIVAGLFLAMAVPQLTVRLFMQGMPAIWNLTYLLCLAGLYLVILSAVGHSKKGRHPEKYYRNIISTNLMRFTARQTTRNMCVIALLVFVIIATAFWGVMYYFSATESGIEAPYDYSLHYPAGEDQIGRQEIEQLAEKYGLSLSSYKNLDSLELIIRYTGRDTNDQKQYFDVEYEKLASFVSASDFAKISGQPVSLKKGEYMTITQTGFRETIWVNADCLNLIRHPVTNDEMVPAFRGTVEFDNLAVSGSNPFAFLLSDEDYEHFMNGMTAAYIEKHIFFNTAYMPETHTQAEKTGQPRRRHKSQNALAYDFAAAVKQMYIAHASDLSSHCRLYDAHEEALALAAGREYAYAGEIDLSPNNPQALNDWKYAPFSKILMQADAMELVAVFVLLSIYISVISLAAAGIMSYIRSITIAMDNRQLFEDLRKLGADDAYEENVLKVQLKKIFAYPAAAGCMIVAVFSLFLTYFNDMRLQAFEIKMLLMEGALMVCIGGILYGVYRAAYGKAKKIVGIKL